MAVRLRFGLWYSLRNPAAWSRPFTDIYRDTLDQIAWAETIGYEDVWLTEHHFCDDGHAPSILTLATAAAMRTQRMRVGTSVLLLPLHDAVKIAEDTATIDVLSNGRFDLGVGIGYRPQEFAGLGLDKHARASRMDEGLEIIRALWRGETVDFKGKHYRIEGAKLAPRPVQDPMPLWVGGFAPASAKRAARIGNGYIGTGDMAPMVKLYRDELERLGKADQARVAGGHFWLIASRTPEKTLAWVGPHVLYQIQMYNHWAHEAGQELFPPVDHYQQLVEYGLLKVVTATQAVDEIGAYAELTGIERYYTWSIPPGIPERQLDPHLQLFAEEVIKHFK